VPPERVFADRIDAGRQLGTELAKRDIPANAIVCGIPRGGVVVAAEVARALDRPLRAVVARKIGAPGHEELAIGAVGPDGVAVVDYAIARRAGASQAWLAAEVERVGDDVRTRIAAFPEVVTAAEVHGGLVIVVDDGVATGSTAAAVGRWLSAVGAAERMLALPVAPSDTIERLRADYEEIVVLSKPAEFTAVGKWYRDFSQTSDEAVRALLERPAGG
jgi:putative phosphoribosyl transferase